MERASYVHNWEWNAQKPPLGYGIRTDGKEAWLVPYIITWHLLNEGAGAMANEICQRPPLIGLLGNWHPVGAVAGASDTWKVTGNVGSNTDPITIVANVLPLVVRATGQNFVKRGVSTYNMALAFWGANSYSFLTVHTVPSTAADQIYGRTPPVPSKVQSVVGTFIGGSTIALYVDGQLEKTSVPGSVLRADTTGFNLGTNADNCVIVSGGLVQKAFSAAEVAELYRRPYAMIEPYSFGRVLYIPPVGGWLPPGMIQPRVPFDPRAIL